MPVIRDALAALGIARVGVDGYEADDVIGTLTHRPAGGTPVDVVTGDRDLFQLVDDEAQVRVLYTAKGGVRDPDLVDQAFLQARYGVATGAGLRRPGDPARRHQRRAAGRGRGSARRPRPR